jgi:hypothetical protein
VHAAGGRIVVVVSVAVLLVVVVELDDPTRSRATNRRP